MQPSPDEVWTYFKVYYKTQSTVVNGFYVAPPVLTFPSPVTTDIGLV
jgi:hypothetical protein